MSAILLIHLDALHVNCGLLCWDSCPFQCGGALHWKGCSGLPGNVHAAHSIVRVSRRMTSSSKPVNCLLPVKSNWIYIKYQGPQNWGFRNNASFLSRTSKYLRWNCFPFSLALQYRQFLIGAASQYEISCLATDDQLWHTWSVYLPETVFSLFGFNFAGRSWIFLSAV